MYRSTKKEKAYHEYRPTEVGCYFCKPEPKVIVKRFNDFYIMKNNFSYDFWDGQNVLEHLMLVTKKHDAYLVGRNELLEQYSKIMNKYNKLGYDIFIRTSGSPSRSQAHFHTHLIKASGKKFNKLVYTFVPYKLTVE